MENSICEKIKRKKLAKPSLSIFVSAALCVVVVVVVDFMNWYRRASARAHSMNCQTCNFARHNLAHRTLSESCRFSCVSSKTPEHRIQGQSIGRDRCVAPIDIQQGDRAIAWNHMHKIVNSRILHTKFVVYVTTRDRYGDIWVRNSSTRARAIRLHSANELNPYKYLKSSEQTKFVGDRRGETKRTRCACVSGASFIIYVSTVDSDFFESRSMVRNEYRFLFLLLLILSNYSEWFSRHWAVTKWASAWCKSTTNRVSLPDSLIRSLIVIYNRRYRTSSTIRDLLIRFVSVWKCFVEPSAPVMTRSRPSHNLLGPFSVVCAFLR